MPKKTAAAPAPAAAALACGNAACGKTLAPPLLQCSKCKAEAYCCKACQVGDPGAPAAHSAPYASARSPAPAARESHMLASSLQTKMQEMVLDMAEITKAHILKSTLYRVFA